MKKKKLLLIIILILSLIMVIDVCAKMWVNYNINKPQIPVLMYHSIIYDELYNNEPEVITLSAFEEQMKYLNDNGYKTLTLDQLYDWKKGKNKSYEKAVVLTFDDGFYNVYYLARPILEKYDFHAAEFIIGSSVNKVTKPFNQNEYGTIGLDVISTTDSVIEYQSHSYDLHQLIDGKKKILISSNLELENDLSKMKELMEPTYMTYPYNTDTSQMRSLLKKYNYKLAFRCESEKATKEVDNYQVPRIGVSNDFEDFKTIFETTSYNNRYGNGLLRKILVTIERKFKMKLF
ncbi:MAG: polysaccharide deacetylase family protein [Bacilli bacterium]|jgi:peptidoglycan/xylan/chitin deacetylase (PgdA/CDA1 family)